MMDLNDVLKHLKSGKKPFEVIDEMALLRGGVPSDWTPAKSTPSFKGKDAQDVIRFLAEKPRSHKELANWFHGGKGGGSGFDRVLIHLRHTSYIGKVKDQYALTDEGVQWAKKISALVSKETQRLADDATRATASYNYQPTTSTTTGGATTKYRNDRDAIQKVRKALGPMASDTPMGKRTNIRSHGEPGFKYTQDPKGGAQWTITVDIQKTGARIDKQTQFIGGKKIEVVSVDKQDEKKIEDAVRRELKKDNIDVNDLAISGYTPDGDCIITFTSDYTIPTFGIVTKTKYRTIYDPYTGKPVGKEVLAGAGQMTLWPESIRKAAASLIEALR